MGRLLSVALACVTVACGVAQQATAPDPLAGTYTGAGSSTTLENARLMTEAFSKKHPGVRFQLNVTDTETTIVKVNAADADADFGFIAREPKPTEDKVTLTPLGSTGSAFAVNSANTVRALTKVQLKAILSGEIVDWSAVGGKGAIRVLIREPSSQTRSGLEQYVFGSEKPTYAPTAYSTSDTGAASGEMLDTLKSFTGAIGMVTLDSKAITNKSIQLVTMDGIPPTLESLATGKWPVRRPAYLATHIDPTKLKPAIKALIQFATNPDGLRALEGR